MAEHSACPEQDAAFSAWRTQGLASFVRTIDADAKPRIILQSQSWASDVTKSSLQKLVAGRVTTSLGDMATAAKCFASAFVGDSRLRLGDEFEDFREMCLPDDLESACRVGMDAASKILEAALLRDDCDSDVDDSAPPGPTKRSRSADRRPGKSPGQLLQIGKYFFDSFIDDPERATKTQKALFILELCWATRERAPLFNVEPQAWADGPVYNDVRTAVKSRWGPEATLAGHTRSVARSAALRRGSGSRLRPP